MMKPLKRGVNVNLAVNKGLNFPSQYRYKCVISLNSGETYRTTKKKGPDPVWEERFSFACGREDQILFYIWKLPVAIRKKEIFGLSTVSVKEFSTPDVEHVLNLEVKGVDTTQTCYFVITIQFTVPPNQTLQRRASAPFFPVSSPRVSLHNNQNGFGYLNGSNCTKQRTHIQFPDEIPPKSKTKMRTTENIDPFTNKPPSPTLSSPSPPCSPVPPFKHPSTTTKDDIHLSRGNSGRAENGIYHHRINRNENIEDLANDHSTVNSDPSNKDGRPFEEALDELIRHSNTCSGQNHSIPSQGVSGSGGGDKSLTCCSSNTSPLRRQRKKNSTKSQSPRSSRRYISPPRLNSYATEDLCKLREEFEIFRQQQIQKDIEQQEKILALEHHILMLQNLLSQFYLSPSSAAAVVAVQDSSCHYPPTSLNNINNLNYPNYTNNPNFLKDS